MPVSTITNAEEFEDKGHAEFEFVGFRYTGDRSIVTNIDIRTRAGYNGPAKFQRGLVYFAVLPTKLDSEHVANAGMGVHALESRNDFEVIYDRERLARALLKRNYLPPDVFYEGFDRYKRRKAMAKLGLDDHGRVFDTDDEEPYRAQLRAIAGIEEDEAATVSKQRADEYTHRFSRSEASAVVKALRQDSDEINLNTAGKTDMAAYLTRFAPATVETAVNVALGDEDPAALDEALAAERDADVDGSKDSNNGTGDDAIADADGSED
jgi:hypothetical protein